MLQFADVEQMRRDAEATLGSICNVITVTRTRDARGNVAEAVVTGIDFVCHVAPVGMTEGARENESAGQITALNGFKVLHPVTIPLTLRDRLIVEVGEAVRELEVIATRSVATNAVLNTAIATEVPV